MIYRQLHVKSKKMERFLDTVSAVSNDTRVEILDYIQTHGKSCVCEMEKALNLGQARLSTNLNILKKAGFLKVERNGKWAYYDIVTKESLHVKLLEEIQALKLNTPKKVFAYDIKG